MMTQIQIKGSDYGLEESKAKEISGMFKPMLDKMEELEKEKAERDALIEENERVRREAEKAKKALQDAKKVPPSPTFLDKPIPEYIIEPVIEQSPASLSEKSKMDALISELQMLKWKYNFREENYVKVYNDVGVLIDKVLNHIDKKLHNGE